MANITQNPEDTDVNDLEAIKIYKNQTFAIGLMLQFMIEILVVIVNSVFMLVIRNISTMDRNVRVILANHACACISFAVVGITLMFYRVITSATSVRSDRCYLEESATAICSLVIVFSMLAVGIERMYATSVLRQLASARRIRKLGPHLVLAIWTISLVFYMVMLVGSFVKATEHKTLVYCTVIFTTPKPYLYWLICSIVAVEIVTAALFHAVLQWNRSIQNRFGHGPTADQQSLVMRVQLRRNIKATDMLITTVVLHSIVYLPCCIGFPLVRIWLPTSTEWRYVWSQYLINVLTPIYMALQPILLAWRTPIIRSKLYKLLGSNRVVAGSEPSLALFVVEPPPKSPSTHDEPDIAAAETSRYFEQMRNLWGSTAPQKH